MDVIVKGSYKLTPMPLRDDGKRFKFGVNREAMPYNVYTYENVIMGACSIQSVLDIPEDGGKQQLLYNLENSNASQLKAWIIRSLIKYSKMQNGL